MAICVDTSPPVDLWPWLELTNGWRVDAGESGRVGEAIAWLQLGRDALDESAKRGAAMRLGAKARDKRDKVATADDLTDLDGFAKAYAKLNDTVRIGPGAFFCFPISPQLQKLQTGLI